MITRELSGRLIAEGDCLVYSGHRNEQGYGLVHVGGGRRRTAHRMAWEAVNGPIAEGLVVMHECDNPPCCRIEHLRLGTVADNNADRHAKGRSVIPTSNWGWQRNLTHCKQGHAFSEANTYVASDGKRCCRTCRRAASARYRKARSA